MSRTRTMFIRLDNRPRPGRADEAHVKLAKISDDVYRIPEKDLRQVERANAFFIIPALKGNKMAAMLSSHPPLEKRIERLREIQRQMERGI